MNKRFYIKYFFLLIYLTSFSCQKSLISKKYFQEGFTSNKTQYQNSNNLYFPNYFVEPPLKLVKQFRPSSAMQQQLQLNGNILITPTKDGKIETYDLVKLKRIGRHKLSSKIRANVLPVRNNLIIASEYGKKSLQLFDPIHKKTIWSADLGSIKAIPKILNERLFIATLYGGLFCLNLNSGEQLWQFNPQAQLHTSPLINGKTVFQISEDGKIYALDSENCDQIWETEIGYAGLIDPILINDNLICCSSNGKVLSLNLDGSKNWEYFCKAQIKRNPSATNNQVIIIDQNGFIHSLDLSTGNLLWQYESNTIFGTNPFLNNQYLILGTLENTLLFLEVESGDPVWELELYGRVRTDPILWQDKLIVGSENNYIYVLAK